MLLGLNRYWEFRRFPSFSTEKIIEYFDFAIRFEDSGGIEVQWKFSKSLNVRKSMKGYRKFCRSRRFWDSFGYNILQFVSQERMIKSK